MDKKYCFGSIFLYNNLEVKYMERKGKSVKESKVETYHIIRPSDLNDANRLFGGTLMSWIDEVAALVGKRHASMNVTTLSIDRLHFLRGVFVSDTVFISGKVTYVGNTSMEIKVDSYVEHMSGERELVNTAFLTLVGLDDNNKPAKLPNLILETEEEKKEWNEAKMRKDLRKEYQELGFNFYG